MTPRRLHTHSRREGSILVSLAIMLTALMGLIALSIEVGSWYLLRAELSKAVDAAALAGAANIASPNINLSVLAQDFGNENSLRALWAHPPPARARSPTQSARPRPR